MIVGQPMFLTEDSDARQIDGILQINKTCICRQPETLMLISDGLVDFTGRKSILNIQMPAGLCLHIIGVYAIAKCSNE